MCRDSPALSRPTSPEVREVLHPVDTSSLEQKQRLIHPGHQNIDRIVPPEATESQPICLRSHKLERERSFSGSRLRFCEPIGYVARVVRQPSATRRSREGDRLCSAANGELGCSVRYGVS